MADYDVIVIGVGGMGSATVYQLAHKGYRVLGLERFDIPHSMGSSHGVTRIIRLAYAEHPSYVPLLKRAFALWNETQQQAREQLLYVTGALDIGPDRKDSVFGRSLYSCELHSLDHEVLNAATLMQRFPAIRVPEDYKAIYQPDGGFLLSERAIVVHVTLAQSRGAVVHAREAVLGWEAIDEGVRVRTDKGTYTAGKLVITAGGWANKLITALDPKLAVPERQVLAWLQPQKPDLFKMGALPVWILDVPEGCYYGFPLFSVPGFKFGRMHHLEQTIDPDTMDREAHEDDEKLLRGFAERYFPQGSGPTMALKTCIFTNTPDEHFIVDTHPDYPQVVFGAGYSGHGFKFASVMGEILAELATQGETQHDISLLRLSRFQQK